MPTAMQELLSQPVVLPSPYLEQVVSGFAQQISEYKKVVSELEHALAAQGALRGADGALAAGALGLDVTEALPTVVANLHDYFTHVAAKLERVHNEVRAGLRARARRRGPKAVC
jgi:nucleoporin p58/p45